MAAIKGALTSWKTSTGGIAMITAGISMILNAISGDAVDGEMLASGVGMIIGGISMLFARDNNVSSKDAGAK